MTATATAAAHGHRQPPPPALALGYDPLMADEPPLKLQLPDGTPIEETREAPALPDSAFDAPEPAADAHITLDQPNVVLPPRAELAPHVPRYHVAETPVAPAQAAANAVIETASPAVDLLLSIPASFLPAPWRERLGGLSLQRGAIWSGVLETALALAVGFFGFVGWGDRGAVMSSVGEAAGRVEMGEPQLMGLGALTFLAFLLSPRGFFCAFFFAEGIVRCFAATSAGEVVGTLPLYLAERITFAIRSARDDVKRGKWIPDVALPGDTAGTLIILSCREKLWKPEHTIRADGELYRLAGPAKSHDPSRPHAYLLGPLASDHMIRGIKDWTRAGG